MILWSENIGNNYCFLESWEHCLVCRNALHRRLAAIGSNGQHPNHLHRDLMRIVGNQGYKKPTQPTPKGVRKMFLLNPDFLFSAMCKRNQAKRMPERIVAFLQPID